MVVRVALLIVGVVVDCGCCWSQLTSSSAFVFLSTNTTTWSVCGHRVYKHDKILPQASPPPHKYI